jgi:hypothetical protein
MLTCFFFCATRRFFKPPYCPAADLSRGYGEGTVVLCVVLSESGGRFDLSMRQSRLAPNDVEDGDVVDREVCTIGQCDCSMARDAPE